MTGLSTAELTASTHANLSGCSGHADRCRPSVDAAACCSYLSDCMSLLAHCHLLRALCWLAWCSRQTSGAAAQSKTDEADAGLLWVTSEHQRQCSGSGFHASRSATARTDSKCG